MRNEFGGSLGGPIVLLKLYDVGNRTFFFGAWEGYRNRASNTTSLTMPAMAMRQGDFSGLVDSAGRKITLSIREPRIRSGDGSLFPITRSRLSGERAGQVPLQRDSRSDERQKPPGQRELLRPRA